jgi:uncharacterized protein (TIRG00374 family)
MKKSTNKINKKKIDYNKITNYILLLFGVLALSFFINNINSESILSSLSKINFFEWLILFFLLFLSLFMKSIRWLYLVKIFSGKQIDLSFSFFSVLGGISSATIAPGRLEISKSLLLKQKYNISLLESIPISFFEKFIELFEILFCLVFSALFIFWNNNTYRTFIIFSTLILICFIVIFKRSVNHIFFLRKFLIKLLKILRINKKIIEKIRKASKQSMESILKINQKNAFYPLLVLCILIFFEDCISAYFILSILGIKTNIAIAIFSEVSSLIIGLISFIPAGLGVTEISQTYITKITCDYYYSINSNISLIQIGILIHKFISYYIAIFLGVLILIFNKKITKQKKKNKINTKIIYKKHEI